MSAFHPFPGLRFNPATTDAATVTAPPYDVIDADDRSELLERDACNVTLVDLPDERDGSDRYDAAARAFAQWRSTGVVIQDDAPCLYIYRMSYTDDAGNPAHTLGVIGALDLSEPGDGRILPHEHTTPKAKSDRLDLLRATQVNLSPIWGLSPSSGLTEALTVHAPADLAWTDSTDVHHEMWVVADHERIAHITQLVDAAPVIIADGHHRFETALNYRRERIAATDQAGAAARAMIFIVELIEQELTVRPIHRLVSGVTDEQMRSALEPFFAASDCGPIDATVTKRMAENGALVWVHPNGEGTFLEPRPDAFVDVDDLDSSRLAAALGTIDDASVVYQHGVERIVKAVTGGKASHGFLLRPATVAQIRANADAGHRMPAKTTFFHPKPVTGLVFMSVAD